MPSSRDSQGPANGSGVQKNASSHDDHHRTRHHCPSFSSFSESCLQLQHARKEGLNVRPFEVTRTAR